MSFFTLSSDERLLFTPVSITPLIDTEDACFGLNASRPITKGDLKWRDALLVAHRVNSNNMVDSKIFLVYRIISRYNRTIFCNCSEPSQIS